MGGQVQWMASVCVVAVAMLAGPAHADFESGARAFAEHDYERARLEWLPIAEQGDANAQFSLGVMYSQGLGVAENLSEAVRWFRLAAVGGKSEAQFTLGVFYSQGIVGKPDPDEAIRWYTMAARQGDADAQFALGLLHSGVAGIDLDLSAAAAWFTQAANNGHATSQASLGLMYSMGRGVPQHDVCAYAWLSLAAAAGLESAASKRDKLRSRMTASQVERGQGFSRSRSRAARCLDESANAHVGDALVARVQAGLRELGYSPGSSVGTVDEETVSAVKTFQAAIGIPASGRISNELLALIKLRLDKQ